MLCCDAVVVNIRSVVVVVLVADVVVV